MHTPNHETKCYRINGLSYIPIDKFPNYVINHTGKIFRLTHGEVVPHESKSGYLVVNLHRDGSVHPRLIHRLILNHFDPSWNPETLNVHLDGDKHNNHIRNLSRRKIPLNKAKNEHLAARVGFKVDPTGKVYKSIRAAARETGVTASNISKNSEQYRSFVLNDIRFTQLFA